jgi:hypothetical protein
MDERTDSPLGATPGAPVPAEPAAGTGPDEGAGPQADTGPDEGEAPGPDEGGEPTLEYEWPSGPDGAPGAWQLAEAFGRLAGAPSDVGPARGVVYAEFGLRAAAFALDFALVSVISGFVNQRLGSALQDLLNQQSGLSGTAEAYVLLLTILGLVTGALLLIAFSYVLVVLRATPGQLALGLATLRRRDGRVLGIGAALVRTVLLFGPLEVLAYYPTGQGLYDSTSIAQHVGDVLPAVAALWYLALALSVFGDRRGRGVHDLAAGSVVIREVDEA